MHYSTKPPIGRQNLFQVDQFGPSFGDRAGYGIIVS